MRVRYPDEAGDGGAGDGIGIAPGGAGLVRGDPYCGGGGGEAEGAPAEGGPARGIDAPGGASPWGRVNPHFGQKSAPSAAI